jgi:16S rRNA A1518/A1519 N6-dimethyltransferase RsmA/KsgA/DIM1 with predicted DNA glycosylase/AP lyase activity
VLALVEQGFTQRRKRLRNALAPRVPAAAVDDALTAIGRSADTRAEQLDLRTWCELTIALRERRVGGWQPAALA